MLCSYSKKLVAGRKYSLWPQCVCFFPPPPSKAGSIFTLDHEKIQSTDFFVCRESSRKKTENIASRYEMCGGQKEKTCLFCLKKCSVMGKTKQKPLDVCLVLGERGPFKHKLEKRYQCKHLLFEGQQFPWKKEKKA